jgi:mRNA-degrading endonuclease RelE of RelBE toxin-antitoxin system
MATILAMPRRPAYEVIFDTLALDHMDAIESKYHALIRRTVDEQLSQEPDVPTRNRKPLLRETVIAATWEVRCGPGNRFRIFYDVHRDQRLVVVLAIARKVRNQLFAGKEKFEP